MVFCPSDHPKPDEARDELGRLKPNIVVVRDTYGVTLFDSAENEYPKAHIYIQCSQTPTEGWTYLIDVFWVGTGCHPSQRDSAMMMHQARCF